MTILSYNQKEIRESVIPFSDVLINGLIDSFCYNGTPDYSKTTTGNLPEFSKLVNVGLLDSYFDNSGVTIYEITPVMLKILDKILNVGSILVNGRVVREYLELYVCGGYFKSSSKYLGISLLGDDCVSLVYEIAGAVKKQLILEVL